MDIESIVFSEVSQTEKNKELYDTTYIWNLKVIQMSVYTKQKKIHRYRVKLVVLKGEREWERNKLEV